MEIAAENENKNKNASYRKRVARRLVPSIFGHRRWRYSTVCIRFLL